MAAKFSRNRVHIRHDGVNDRPRSPRTITDPAPASAFPKARLISLGVEPANR